MNARAIGASAVTGLLLAGCTHPENYRWSDYSPPVFLDKISNPAGSSFKEWSKPSVSVYSFATASPANPDATLKDLSDRGQAALIAAMTDAGAKPEDIRDALSKPLKGKSEPIEGALTTEGTYKRTLVANVTKGWDSMPGDRLVWTWIDVRPLNFAFDGYSIIATDNQVLNIEQITNATTAAATANLGKTGSDTTATTTAGTPVSSVVTDVAGSSAGLQGSLSNTRTTTASINQQYVKLGADIVPEELRIYRESERNLDVAGNTLIALTAKLDPTKWNGVRPETTLRVTKIDLANSDGSFKSPSEIAFDVTENEAPPRCALQARVVLYYQIRRPKNGRSYVEGDHEAVYEKAMTAPIDVDIIPADEVRKPSWRVYPRQSPTTAISVIGPFENTNEIDFTSYEQARNFAVWLNRQGGSLKGKMSPAIGTSGLKLDSGVDGQPIYTGDYFAKRTADPNDLVSLCKGMMLPQPPVAAVVIPAPVSKRR